MRVLDEVIGLGKGKMAGLESGGCCGGFAPNKRSLACDDIRNSESEIPCRGIQIVIRL